MNKKKLFSNLFLVLSLFSLLGYSNFIKSADYTENIVNKKATKKKVNKNTGKTLFDEANNNLGYKDNSDKNYNTSESGKQTYHFFNRPNRVANNKTGNGSNRLSNKTGKEAHNSSGNVTYNNIDKNSDNKFSKYSNKIGNNPVRNIYNNIDQKSNYDISTKAGKPKSNHFNNSINNNTDYSIATNASTDIYEFPQADYSVETNASTDIYEVPKRATDIYDIYELPKRAPETNSSTDIYEVPKRATDTYDIYELPKRITETNSITDIYEVPKRATDTYDIYELPKRVTETNSSADVYELPKTDNSIASNNSSNDLYELPHIRGNNKKGIVNRTNKETYNKPDIYTSNSLSGSMFKKHNLDRTVDKLREYGLEEILQEIDIRYIESQLSRDVNDKKSQFADVFAIAQDARHINGKSLPDKLNLYIEALALSTNQFEEAKVLEAIAKMYSPHNFDLAKKLLEKGIAIDKENIYLHNRLADLYNFNYKDIQEADKYYSKTMALIDSSSKGQNFKNKKKIEILRTQLRGFIDREEYDSAFIIIQKIKDIDPTPKILRDEGGLYDKLVKKAKSGDKAKYQNLAFECFLNAYEHEDFKKQNFETRVKIFSNLAASYYKKPNPDFQKAAKLFEDGDEYIKANLSKKEKKTVPSFYISYSLFYKNNKSKEYRDKTESVFEKSIKMCEKIYSYETSKLYLEYGNFLKEQEEEYDRALTVFLDGFKQTTDRSPENSIDLLIAIAKEYLRRDEMEQFEYYRDLALKISEKFSLHNKKEEINNLVKDKFTKDFNDIFKRP